MHVSHTGENTAALLNEAVTEWGLGAKDPVVTDNASNMTVAARHAEVTTPQQDQTRDSFFFFFKRSTIASEQLKLKQEPAPATKSQIDHRRCYKMEQLL